MKKIILSFVVCESLFSTLSAGCLGFVVGGECKGHSSSYINNSDESYSGNSGRTYQYDLSNQHDRLRYSTDTSAQKRDMSGGSYVDRTRDQGRGQFGGGMY